MGRRSLESKIEDPKSKIHASRRDFGRHVIEDGDRRHSVEIMF